MDAVVQMVRNMMCCIKDLQLFSNSFLYDPNATQAFLKDFYTLPEPLNQTTPLEVAISITQFYAFVSISLSGINLIFSAGFGKMGQINKLIETRPAQRTLADLIVAESISKELTASKRSIFVGINVLSIGLAFFWLFANSWHVTDTNWIGGVQGLIHALTIMLVALVPLLYYMIIDAIDLISKAARVDYLISILRKCEGTVPSEIITAETLELMSHNTLSPLWSCTGGGSESLSQEMETLQSTLNRWLKPSDDKWYTKQAIHDTADRLETEVKGFRYLAYREVLYFAINSIAFYGYFLGVVAYYAHPELESQTSFVRTLKFGMSNDDADWHGNFAGDIMWTIEPMFILASPAFFTWLKSKKVAAKAKTD